MILPDFTAEHLKQLPLREIVAFAIRCARRVQPLAQLPESHPERERLPRAIEDALRMAEGFASGSTARFADSVVETFDESRSITGIPLGADQAASAAAEAAHAAACSWRLIRSREAEEDEPGELKTVTARKFLGDLKAVTADLAALAAFTAAVEAYDAVGYHNEEFVAAALNDYNRLLRLELGRYPEVGDPIDPSPEGPLGPW